MLDIHSHVLFEVDDGADGPDETKRMLDAAAKAGITRAAATPHLRGAEASDERICAAYRAAREWAAERGIELLLGREAAYLATPRLLEAEDLHKYSISTTRYMLTELPAATLPPKWEFALEDIISKGYKPVIVHPERFLYVQDDARLQLVSRFKKLGCLIQPDADSFFAQPFSPVRRAARRIMKAGMADFFASDAHSARDYAYFARAVAEFGALKLML